MKGLGLTVQACLFEGEIFVRYKLTTPLQIFFHFVIYFKVIIKSIIVADDTCIQEISRHERPRVNCAGIFI